ncbi:MAG: signal peptide peptidase SppA, partial [Paramuribaculum sp.]|nr:signal peptide peptidase SppA [Paramuribaculum sp.]
SGLILRVNSGGGSAFASEQIWQALEQFKAKTGKPFYVSMGDYAASGGYYISCGADKIFAEPVTLTGSIGIFGMIPSAEKLLSDKLGVNSGTVATNATRSITLFKPMTENQRMKMQSYVDRGYELFTSRCAEGRHLSVDSIKAIAEGRVWDGKSALEIGLVDSLGRLDDAVAAMAGELGVYDDNNFYVVEYPKVKLSFLDEILSAGDIMSAKAIENNLGPVAPVIRSVKELRNLDPMQCRMDYILIN